MRKYSSRDDKTGYVTRVSEFATASFPVGYIFRFNFRVAVMHPFAIT
jgi:hypothetical protein